MTTLTMANYITSLKFINREFVKSVEVSGMPSSILLDLAMKNYHVSTETELLQALWTEETQLITYKAKGGKFTPMGVDVVNIANFAPLDLKMIASYSADEVAIFLETAGGLRDSSYAKLSGAFKLWLAKFLRTKQRMQMSQVAQALGEGKVTFQYETDKGLHQKTVDYTSLDGAITAVTYADGVFHDWSASATTGQHIFQDLGYLRKTRYNSTNGAFFGDNAPLICFMGSTAYASMISKYDTEDPVIAKDGWGFYIQSGNIKIRVIETSMNREYKYMVAGVETDTSTDMLAAKDIMLFDSTQGNLGMIDLKYNDMENVDKPIASPYNVKFAKSKFDEGVDMVFTSRPIAFVRPKALIKATTQA